MSKKKATGKQLTMAQRKAMLLTPCKTKDELKRWIQYHLGLHLPDQTVSRYADTNPYDIIWELYEICVLKNNPLNVEEILCVAGRGSGKTLGMAIFELLCILHDNRDAVHIGAILNQADRCYAYIKGFMYNRKLKPILMPSKVPEDKRILEKANMSKSIFNLNGEKVTLEIIPCTLKATNGPHVPLVVVDEIDTVSGEGLKAFKEISGMLDSKGDKKAIRIGISTRKSRYGLMNQQIENAEAQDRHVRKWTAFEFSQRCPDDRSGLKPTKGFYIQDDLEVISESDWKLKEKSKQKEYVEHTFPGEKCLKCPIAAICLGDAKNQQSKSPMLKPISEMVKKVRSEGADWALAQLMNLKPSVEGVIYKEFEDKLHVVDWNFMWKKLTGKDYPGECTNGIFVQKCHELGLPCYAGIDWGWSNPSTVVFFFVDSRENIYVVRCDGMTYYSEPAWIHHIKTKWHNMYRCQLYFPDQASQGAIQEMKKAGLPTSNNKKKDDIMTGVQTIKKLLKTPGTQEPKMFFAKETCQPIIEEFTMYHFKRDAAGEATEDPEKSNDHWLDGLRYAIHALFGGSTMIMSGDSAMASEHGAADASGNFLRTPSPSEFAAQQGLQINEEIDTSKIGKVGKASDLTDDDDDDGFGGDGSFLWSF
jgi:hypothetical protein